MSVADLSHGSSVQEIGGKGATLSCVLCVIKTRLNSMNIVLVRYSKRDGRRLNVVHADTVFIQAQPIDHRSTIRVVLGEILQLSIRVIGKPLQPRMLWGIAYMRSPSATSALARDSSSTSRRCCP